MEYIKEIKVKIVKETNKRTDDEELILGDEETIEEFIERANQQMKKIFLDE